MEYYTPKTWPNIFLTEGFKEIATYSSAKSIGKIDYDDPLADKFEAKMSDLNLLIRPFNLERAQVDLRAIYELSLLSFSRNFLYTDISLNDFLSLYEKILPYIQPDFLLLAEQEGNLVGFAFAMPDYLQQQRGVEIDTVVLKTLARVPNNKAYSGLGNYLLHQIHKRAAKRGMKSVVPCANAR